MLRPLLLIAACLVCPAHAASVAVRAQPLSEIAVFPAQRAPATVVSNAESVLGAEIAARVVALPPRVGDVVAAGEVIARLDCRDYVLARDSAQASLKALEARLVLAERRLTRARELGQRQSLAVEVVDEREAEQAVILADISGAKAAIRRAAVDVERCKVLSPFRALVRERLAPVGEYVQRGDPIARVINLDDLELSARVRASDVAALLERPGLEFASAGRRYAVSIRSAVDAVDTETGNREIRLTFDAVRPLAGAAGELEWRAPGAHVPGSVLVRREGVLGLFTVSDGSARFVAVPNAQSGRASVVDLDAATLIVTEGHYGLRDGQQVDVLGGK